MKFDEHALEMSIMELFVDEQYEHLVGTHIHKEKSELLPTAKEGVPTIIANAGMIVFIVISTLLAAIQLIAPILSAG